MTKKTELLKLRVEPSLKAALLEFAAKDPERHYSKIIRRLIRKEIGFPSVVSESERPTDLVGLIDSDAN